MVVERPTWGASNTNRVMQLPENVGAALGLLRLSDFYIDGKQALEQSQGSEDDRTQSQCRSQLS